jgi:hypothetical protein
VQANVKNSIFLKEFLLEKLYYLTKIFKYIDDVFNAVELLPDFKAAPVPAPVIPVDNSP